MAATTTQISTETRLDLIRKKAYDLYVQRGRKPGREVEDWLQAEKIVDREIAEDQGSTRTDYAKEAPRSAAPPVRPNPPAKVGGFKR